MSHVVILGAGVMGSAFSLPLADAGSAVTLVGTHLDRELIDGVRRDRCHPRLNAVLPERVEARHHEELGDVLAKGVDLVVLGVSSAGVEWAVDRLRPHLTSSVPILMLTKGLVCENNRLGIFPTGVSKALNCPVGGVGGPCIAGELAVRRQTSVVVSFGDEALVRQALALLDAPYYHARASRDLVGVEVCAALKNFMALGIGAALGQLDIAEPVDNRAQMHNHAAGLFNQALLELDHINAALGGEASTVRGLAGTGDLYVTVQGGRNSRMGRLLGAGWRYREAKAGRMAEDTVEGAELALSVGGTMLAMIERGDLDAARLPLSRAILRAIRDNETFDIPWNDFYR
ncbi:MAG: glycerol-3-phosphate dehydrogenase [Geminicoccaceae bacterium]|nr:hypothetical protein [Geminicoccaceae bacterium]MCB9942873.1 glycerol-3-phosphate dehydrogenase [Geminicoccaceae bacterium]